MVRFHPVPHMKIKYLLLYILNFDKIFLYILYIKDSSLKFKQYKTNSQINSYIVLFISVRIR